MNTQHTIRVRLFDARQSEPLDGGLITVHGEPYGLSDDRALELAMSSGHFDPGPRFIRWRGILMPSEHFVRLEVSVESQSVD